MISKTKPIVAAVAMLIATSAQVQAQPQEAAPAMEEVVVVGHIIAAERRALAQQKEANRIVNIISADGIGDLPDHNAAEAVQRVPGVSIERDQGEGRFVAVRGLPAQWNSTTLNGDRIPTAEEETTSRATAFDFFPSELIERIEVSKALTPDMEGDAIGGNVNFVTATAPDARIIALSAATNYNDKAGKAGYSANAVYGDITDDGRFGFLINGTVWQRHWATDNFEPRRSSDGYGIRRLELRDYTGERTTYGINFAGEFNPSDAHKLFARFQYGTLADDETHYKHRYRFDSDRVELQNIFDELITEFNSVEVGGEHFIGDGEIDWKISSASNQFKYGCIPNCADRSYFVVRFDQDDVGYVGLGNDADADAPYSYNQIDGGPVPGNHPFTHLPDGFAMDPALTALDSVELYKVDVNEKDKLVAALDYQRPLSNALTLKVGAKYRDKERDALYADEFWYWDDSAGEAPTLADFGLIDQPGRYEYDIGTENTYSDDFSGVVREGDLVSWFNANRENFVLDEDESALISNAAGLGRNFDVSEQQAAVYGMATWEVNDRWQMVGGLRLEQTNTEVNGFVYLDETDEVVPNSGKKDYLSVLPSLHATYQVSDDANLRMALTRTFARPDFGDLNAGGAYSEADNELQAGNPDLEPTYSNNLDLMYEFYFGEVGLLSAGIFYKDITDPIFSGSSQITFNGNSGVTLLSPQNGDDASLWGAEFAYVRQFDFLPGIGKYFGVNTNLTIMDSEMSIPTREDKVPIPRQADLLYNVTGYFDNGMFAARLAVNHKGEYIEEHHDDDANLDTYYGDYTSVDFTASLQLTDTWQLFMELNNLTDEPLQYYFGSEARPAQVEYYGSRGQLGVKAIF